MIFTLHFFYLETHVVSFSVQLDYIDSGCRLNLRFVCCIFFLVLAFCAQASLSARYPVQCICISMLHTWPMLYLKLKVLNVSSHLAS